jgi:single-strand DNA-binding protein
MNNLRNKVQLIGNLGQAPEIISFENGNKLAKVSLATNESYKNAKGEKVTETQWHSIIAWGKQADIFEKYIKKGQEIAVEGKLVTKSFETKEGEKRFKTEVQVSEILMLGAKEEGAEA